MASESVTLNMYRRVGDSHTISWSCGTYCSPFIHSNTLKLFSTKKLTIIELYGILTSTKVMPKTINFQTLCITEFIDM